LEVLELLRSQLAVLSILVILGCASSYGPINKAALRGDAEAIASLVQKGEDINKVGAHGMTPLINATYYGFAPTVREILRLGPIPTSRMTRNGLPCTILRNQAGGIL
jgi:ankyrin repeat protein